MDQLITHPENLIHSGHIIRLSNLYLNRVLHFEIDIFNKKNKKGKLSCTSGRDYNDWWRINLNCEDKKCPIYSGSIITLTHYITQQKLCIEEDSEEPGSFIVYLSKNPNKEVDEQWSIVLDYNINDKEKVLRTFTKFRLIHMETGTTLHADIKQNPEEDNEETDYEVIACKRNEDENDFWAITEFSLPSNIGDKSYDNSY